jgi:Ca2+-transporting ATPase
MAVNHFSGLSDSEVNAARTAHGTNAFQRKRIYPAWEAIKEILLEPMSLLLLATAAIYFITGKQADAYFMLGAIAIVSGISLFQNARTRSALSSLEQLTQPKCQIFRDGKLQEFPVEEIVMGDFVQVSEGGIIPADGVIKQAHDFTVNESILTGESMPVTKTVQEPDNTVFQGTTTTTGLVIFEVNAIGNAIKLGKIGKQLESIEVPKTPLQIQIQNFVTKMVIAGSVVFAIVWGIHFYLSHEVLNSLLKALTLAMSVIPEEIPVAFTTFMALGAFRLMKAGVLVKNTQMVETLGSATVICTDKTGTITENRMSLAKVFVFESKQVEEVEKGLSEKGQAIVEWAMWASEPIAFDPMEQALHQVYEAFDKPDRRPDFKLIHEYPLEGKPPMMTHQFEGPNGERIMAAKGAAAALMEVSGLSDEEREIIHNAANQLSEEGYRILGVGVAQFEGDNYPEKQQDIRFEFKGLVAFFDPPKKNMEKVFKAFYQAGIQVKIITGDSMATTATIAKQVGFLNADKVMSGDQIIGLSDADLGKAVKETAIFARMFPEAKLKVINALKANGEVVAMTGDGVNDGLALKAANIGIAMGNRGSEIAKQAAGLVLLHDNFEAMVKAVAMGRRIYINLKKAILYVIAIHIPMILTVLVPLALGWAYPVILAPVHIIFLELIMGPTCSIIYENEPMESNQMEKKPRLLSHTFFGWHELTGALIQGLVIMIGTLSMYQYSVINGFSESETRSMVFLTLIAANILLTLVNRSISESFITSFKRKNNLIYVIIPITVTLTFLIFSISYIRNLFGLAAISIENVAIAIGAGFTSVIWFEIVKWFRRRKA